VVVNEPEIMADAWDGRYEDGSFFANIRHRFRHASRSVDGLQYRSIRARVVDQ
jgi:hypothetical protein